MSSRRTAEQILAETPRQHMARAAEIVANSGDLPAGSPHLSALLQRAQIELLFAEVKSREVASWGG